MKKISNSHGAFNFWDGEKLLISIPKDELTGLESDEVLNRANWLWKKGIRLNPFMKKVPPELEREFGEIVKLAEDGGIFSEPSLLGGPMFIGPPTLFYFCDILNIQKDYLCHLKQDTNN
jgi:hypothetical protein